MPLTNRHFSEDEPYSTHKKILYTELRPALIIPKEQRMTNFS